METILPSSELKLTKSLKGTWAQALVTFFSPLVIFFAIRWMIVEPFVIPSESMVPNLLIHDHILVKKFSFGLKLPFTDHWLFRWAEPNAGDIVVFKYPVNPKLFFVKRVIGLPGDLLTIEQGRVSRSREKLTTPIKFKYTKHKTDDLFTEEIDQNKHLVRFLFDEKQEHETIQIEVPPKKYFVMGDNRDASSDSRVWGFVPEENLVGKAWLIWLSCDQTLSDAAFICDPLKLRWNRIFKFLDQNDEH